MDEQIKKNLNKLARETEVKVARSILRWKYKKEKRPAPMDHQLENESKEVAARAHEVIARRGKIVWNELKKVYFKGSREKEDKGE